MQIESIIGSNERHLSILDQHLAIFSIGGTRW